MTGQRNDVIISRVDATKFLSTEFFVGLVFQTMVFLVLGAIAWGQLRAEVAGVKDAQDVSEMAGNPAKIARIETQLASVVDSQKLLRGDVKDLTAAVDKLKDEVRRGNR